MDANESGPPPDSHFDLPEAVMAKAVAAVEYPDAQANPLAVDQLWREALAAAEVHGMDPMGQDVLAMKLLRIRMLEESGQRERAIDVVEQLRRDCQSVIGAAEWPRVALERQSRTAAALTHLVQTDIMLMDLRAGEPVLNYDAAEEARVHTAMLAVELMELRRMEDDWEGDAAHVSGDELMTMMLSYVGEVHA